MDGAIESLLAEITNEIKINEIAEAEHQGLLQETAVAEATARFFGESLERARGRESMAKAASINAQSRRIELEKAVSDNAAGELLVLLQGAATSHSCERRAKETSILSARAYISDRADAAAARLTHLKDATRDARQRLEDFAQTSGRDEARVKIAHMRCLSDTAAVTRETEIHRGIEARCVKLATEMQIKREGRDDALAQELKTRADTKSLLAEAARAGRGHPHR
jgi:hypothetical protein